MKLSDITATFVQARYDELRGKWATFRDWADVYEKVYSLDIWQSAGEPDERRISAPIAWSVIEAYRSLLLTRPPVISVAPSETRYVEAERASLIEKYLYGVWDVCHVTDALNKAEWYANCFGMGVIRVLFDSMAVEDDLPLLIHAPDPRNVYAAESGKPGLDSEVVYAYSRPRREIESEYGVTFADGRPTHIDTLTTWLDEEVDFIDYWRMDTVVVSEPEPVIVSTVQQALEPVPPQPMQEEELVEPLPELEGEPVVETLEGEPVEILDEEVEEVEVPMRRVRRRKVTNCIVADGNVIKSPVYMVGYNRIPFIRFAGIGTPLPNEKGFLSALFPLTGGSQLKVANVTGLLATASELLAMKQQIIQHSANGALLAKGTEEEIDLGPGAINYVDADADVRPIMTPGPSPMVDQQTNHLERMINEATIGEPMRGGMRIVSNLSGLAMNAILTPSLMKIASRQEPRERAYQAMNNLILSLTDEYAVGPDYPEGWFVWGTDKAGQVIDLVITPEDIGGYYRNRVKLSASLPKDDTGKLMALANLVKQGLVSKRTFLETFQEMEQSANQSPEDEQMRIYIERVVDDPAMQQVITEIVKRTQLPPEMMEALDALQAQSPQGTPPDAPQGAGLPGGIVPPGSGLMGGEMPPPVAMALQEIQQSDPDMFAELQSDPERFAQFVAMVMEGGGPQGQAPMGPPAGGPPA